MTFFTQSIVSRIAQSHIHYPKRIAECVKLPYGLLYHDRENPGSHMCNHAVITDMSGDLDLKVRQVTEFYVEKGLTPVIYTAFQRKAYRIMSQPLRNNGYSVGKYPEGAFFYYPQGQTGSLPNYSNRVKRVQTEEGILDMFSDDEEGVYNRTVIRKLLPGEGYYLWCVYEKDKPVAVASLVMMSEYRTSVIDNVYTVPEYRNKGYATAIVRHALRMHQACSDNLVFLYAYKEQPIRIYRKLGFVKVNNMRLEYWNAWMDI
ncbi:MAG TPA: hypothetical protein DDZ89_12920 [Clostridiales bacterium]|nr:hypothetical protein [Clostridiales bacterium]